MNYINENILLKHISRDELIKLTDDNNTGNTNTEIVNEAISIASNEFDNYLRDVYDLALIPSPLPDSLKQLIIELTIYHLYKRRFRADMPESITEIYKMAIDKLSKISKGEINLSIPMKANQGFIKTNKKNSDRIFGKEALDKI